MARSVLLVFTNATDENDEEFNRWYDEVHMKEVTETPGFIGCERFEISDEQMDSGERKHRYLAIYDIEGDPAAALKALKESAPRMQMTDTLNVDAGTSLFTQITARLAASN
jgi:hypothetical protein